MTTKSLHSPALISRLLLTAVGVLAVSALLPGMAFSKGRAGSTSKPRVVAHASRASRVSNAAPTVAWRRRSRARL